MPDKRRWSYGGVLTFSCIRSLYFGVNYMSSFTQRRLHDVVYTAPAIAQHRLHDAGRADSVSRWWLHGVVYTASAIAQHRLHDAGRADSVHVGGYTTSVTRRRFYRPAYRPSITRCPSHGFGYTASVTPRRLYGVGCTTSTT